MTQEDKNLLFKDLCARLPYGVNVEYDNNACEVLSIDKYNEELTIWICPGYCPVVKLENVKPFLFPLLSMTMDQGQQWHKYANDRGGLAPSTDWLNANHFDYRDLIPKGLANDASNLNIY